MTDLGKGGVFTVLLVCWLLGDTAPPIDISRGPSRRRGRG